MPGLFRTIIIIYTYSYRGYTSAELISTVKPVNRDPSHFHWLLCE